MRSRSHRPCLGPLALALAAVLFGGCDRDGADAAKRGLSRVLGRTVSSGSSALGPLQLTPIVNASDPVALAARPGPGTLHVAEKRGRVRRIEGGALAEAPVLDLSGRVSEGSEQGLLGLAFSPKGDTLYVNFTDASGDSRVVAYAMGEHHADPASARELLRVKQPFRNHNGGNVVLGPDGNLWIGLGDGGSAGDPKDAGQSLGTLLGKMLRITPTPAGERPYTIPADNPYARPEGAADAPSNAPLPEIWAYGLRNPWRYGFDRKTGDLWIADVGQNLWEEVNVVRAPLVSPQGDALNFGWARLEGSHAFRGEAPARSVLPVHEYAHKGGACSVTGGFVYRGRRIPALEGVYVFGDFCTGRLEGLRPGADGRAQAIDLGLKLEALASFGEDANGELYALSLTGVVARIDPAGAAPPGGAER